MNEFQKNNTQTILIVILTTISALSLGYIALDGWGGVGFGEEKKRKEGERMNEGKRSEKGK